MAENAIEVQEKPILFSGAMVRAVIEGRKTQTRHVAKLACQLADKHKNVRMESGDGLFLLTREAMHSPKLRENFCFACPYGQPGDRLWVRETFARCACDSCRSIWPAKTPHGILGYRATYGGPSMMVFKPSIHMPRWASRLTLEIVSVKVERVQEISEEDAIAEGCERNVYTTEDVANLQISDANPAIKEIGRILGPGCVPAKANFQRLWDSINEKRGFGWKANPWTWAIEFQVLAAGERRA